MNEKERESPGRAAARGDYGKSGSVERRSVIDTQTPGYVESDEGALQLHQRAIESARGGPAYLPMKRRELSR
jgi:hypothetical protein